MTITPLQLEVLQWYYTRGGDHPNLTLTDTWSEQVQRLVYHGLLEKSGPKTVVPELFLTEKGKYWFEYILSVPFPVTTFSIPGHPTHE